MPAPVTQQSIGVTQHAQAAFEEAVANLKSIAQGVDAANETLISGAMVGQAGATFAKAVQQWNVEFYDMVGTLQWMADQLHTEWQTMLTNEQSNTDLAKGIGVPTLPGGNFAPPSY